MGLGCVRGYVVGWFEDIKRYRDERHEIIQLRYEIRRLGDEFKKKSEGMKRRSQEFQILLSEYSAEASFSQSRIEELETVQLVRRAIKWGVPIPTRPYQEEKEDDEFWERLIPFVQVYAISRSNR